MFASYLYIEDANNSSYGKEFRRLAELIHVFDSLDGNHRALLIVAEGGPTPERWNSGYPYTGMAMVVGGGPKGYTCTVYTSDAKKHYWLSLEHQENPNCISVNRPNETEIASNFVLPKKIIVESVKEFAKHGTMNKNYIWLKYE